MEWLLELFASSGFGGIIGMIGSFMTRKIELAKMKEQNQFELKTRELDMQEASNERSHELSMADKQMQRAKVEGEMNEREIEAESFKETVKQAAISTGIKFVDAIKGLMRPAITVYLLINTTVLTFAVGSITGGLDNIPSNELADLYKTIILQVVALTALAVSWWFGSRPARS